MGLRCPGPAGVIHCGSGGEWLGWGGWEVELYGFILFCFLCLFKCMKLCWRVQSSTVIAMADTVFIVLFLRVFCALMLTRSFVKTLIFWWTQSRRTSLVKQKPYTTQNHHVTPPPLGMTATYMCPWPFNQASDRIPKISLFLFSSWLFIFFFPSLSPR